MGKVFSIMLTDLRIYFADRGNLVGLLLIPAVLTIVLGAFSNGGGSGSLSIRVIDLDQSELSAQFIREIEAANPQFEIELSEASREAALAMLTNGDMNALLILPEGFSEAVLAYAPIQVDFYSVEESSSPSAMQQSIEAVIGRWNGAIVAEQVGRSVAANINGEIEAGAIYQRAQAILAQEPVRYDYRVATNETEGSGFSQSVPGMGSMFVLFTVLGGLSTLVKERQQWTMQRLVVMPVSRATLLAGKISSFFVLGMLQYAVVIAIGAAFGMDFGANILAFFLVAMAFALCATALSLALATRIRSEGQAGQLTTLLSLALASIGGAWWPLEIVPDFMKIVGHLSPVAWAMDGFHDLLFYGGGLVDVLPEIGILLAISTVLFGIGILGFQYE